jgi:hypothetical protein
MPGVSEHAARLVGALLLYVVASVAAPAGAADRITARYEVYGVMGMRVLTLRTQVERDSDRYAVTAEYATAGIAGFLFEQSTRATANGRITPGSAQPVSFRNYTRRNGTDYQSRVDYGPDGSVDGGVVPAPRMPVPATATRGTVDNLSAYLRLERQLAATQNCALTVAVFDGRHRYDLVFAGGQKETLAPESGQQFQGATIACSMTRHDRNIDDQPTEGAKQGTLWYAALIPGADIMIPVRMRLQTQIGVVDAYLAELRGRGVNLRFIE